MPSACLLVSSCGTIKHISANQDDVHKILGGKITFVGAIPEFNAFVVAARDSNEQVHAWNEDDRVIASKSHTVRGSILIGASDEDGNETDLDTHGVCKWLARQQ